MLETKVKYIPSFLIDAKQIGGEFQNKKVFIVTLAGLVYPFNNPADEHFVVEFL